MQACYCDDCAERPDTTPLDASFRSMLKERHIHDNSNVLLNAQGILFDGVRHDSVEIALPKEGDKVFLKTPTDALIADDFDDFGRRSSSESTRSMETAVSDGARSLRVSFLCLAR